MFLWVFKVKIRHYLMGIGPNQKKIPQNIFEKKKQVTGCPTNLTITFDALNSWWMNKIDFFQYLNANSIQTEEL